MIINNNKYKAFGVKDYAYKERPQATGYIGKEKDRESNLGDHGVRKYDSDLGRFLCPDAMWEKYLAYTPYHYCRNNPINAIDFNGKFSEKVHTEAIVTSGRGNVGWAIFNWIINDIFYFTNSDLHFDNKQNYNQVMKVVNNAGGFNNLNDHTIGDFYSHSNYVDIWQQLSSDGTVSGEIPTFNNASSIPEFQKALENNLRTTNYPDKENDPYGHNKGYEQEGKGNQVGKNGVIIENFGAKDDDKSEDPKLKSLHINAKDVYIRSLKEKVQDEIN